PWRWNPHARPVSLRSNHPVETEERPMERSARPRPKNPAPPPPAPASPPPAGLDLADEPPTPVLAPAAAPAPACVRIEAPALMAEAGFRGVVRASRLVPGEAGAGFAIGAARGAHAPVSPAYIGGAEHALVAADAAGFALNLTPVMRAALWTETSSVALGPDL